MATKADLMAAIAQARVDRTVAVNEVLMAYANGQPFSSMKNSVQAIADADAKAAKNLTEFLKGM
jgi:hypothetical protein